jgi:hypothetical protein
MKVLLAICLLALAGCENAVPEATVYWCKTGIVMKKPPNAVGWEPLDVAPPNAGPEYEKCSPDGPL